MQVPAKSVLFSHYAEEPHSFVVSLAGAKSPGGGSVYHNNGMTKAAVKRPLTVDAWAKRLAKTKSLPALVRTHLYALATSLLDTTRGTAPS